MAETPREAWSKPGDKEMEMEDKKGTNNKKTDEKETDIKEKLKDEMKSAAKKAKEGLEMVKHKSMEEVKKLEAVLKKFENKAKEMGVFSGMKEKLDEIYKEMKTGTADPKALKEKLGMFKLQALGQLEKLGLDEEKKKKISDAISKAGDELKQILNIDAEDEKMLREKFDKIKAKAKEIGKQASKAVKSGVDTVQRFIEHPEEREQIQAEIKEKIVQKMNETKEFAERQIEELKHMDKEKLIEKGKQIAKSGRQFIETAAEKYQKMTTLKSIISHRIHNLKRGLKSVLLSEIENGIEDVYNIESQHHKGLKNIHPGLLIPALTVPYMLCLCQFVNIIWLLDFPFYVSYIIILGLEHDKPCFIDTTTLQTWFVWKGVVDTLFLWPSFYLYYWAGSIKKDLARMKKEDEDADSKGSSTIERNDPDIFEELTGKEHKLQTNAYRSMSALQEYDRYYGSYIRHFRDFWGAIASCLDLIFTISFNHYLENECDKCSDLSLYKIMSAIATIYVTTFLLRVILGLLVFVCIFLHTPCVKKKVIEAAIEFDEDMGIRVAEFSVKYLFYRKPYKGELRIKEEREKLRERKELFKKRKSLMSKWNIKNIN
mmetsp:Transcript_13341/g.19949  ORF Transcript_13341/g.19949 Transcript_13341/m.19949 type:complete len:600 (-) Transcript_13341:425-2224(-)